MGDRREGLLQRLKDVTEEAAQIALQAERLADEKRGLIRRLERLGVSRADLARELGVSRQAISYLMRKYD